MKLHQGYSFLAGLVCQLSTRIDQNLEVGGCGPVRNFFFLPYPLRQYTVTGGDFANLCCKTEPLPSLILRNDIKLNINLPLG
jgi:hypothetical protein